MELYVGIREPPTLPLRLHRSPNARTSKDWITMVPVGYVLVGVVIGICIAVLFFITREHRRRLRGFKKHKEWSDMGYADDWSMPSPEDTVMRFSMNVDGNTVEKLYRMKMLHGFENMSMVVRRAIDITVRLDQLLPNGGMIVTVDEDGAEVPVEIVKVRPEGQ